MDVVGDLADRLQTHHIIPDMRKPTSPIPVVNDGDDAEIRPVRHLADNVLIFDAEDHDSGMSSDDDSHMMLAADGSSSSVDQPLSAAAVQDEVNKKCQSPINCAVSSCVNEPSRCCLTAHLLRTADGSDVVANMFSAGYGTKQLTALTSFPLSSAFAEARMSSSDRGRCSDCSNHNVVVVIGNDLLVTSCSAVGDRRIGQVSGAEVGRCPLCLDLVVDMRGGRRPFVDDVQITAGAEKQLNMLNNYSNELCRDDVDEEIREIFGVENFGDRCLEPSCCQRPVVTPTPCSGSDDVGEKINQRQEAENTYQSRITAVQRPSLDLRKMRKMRIRRRCSRKVSLTRSRSRPVAISISSSNVHHYLSKCLETTVTAGTAPAYCFRSLAMYAAA